MCATAQNVLRRIGIVAITTLLGAKTSVPYAGIRGRNESAAHRCFAGSYDQAECMNRFRNFFKPLMWFMALLLAAFVAGCGGGGDGETAPRAGSSGGVCAGTGCVDLATAGTFAILTEDGITDVPPSAITGNVGTDPITGAAIDVTCAEVSGTIFDVDGAYTGGGAADVTCSVTNAELLDQARTDIVAAFIDAAVRTPTVTDTPAGGDIGTLTGPIAPGVYKWNSGVTISADITLTGGETDVWIFQMTGNLTQADGTIVNLTGGALAKNVFWQVGGGAGVTIGTTAQFKGVILSLNSIALQNGASVDGRLFTVGAVTLIANTITRP